jgi:ABC-type transport system involved in cytochrome c biogenesis permease subunit
MDVKLTIGALALYILTFLFIINRRTPVITAGKVLAVIAFGLQTIALTLRWVASYRAGFGHAPVSNLYESLVVLSWAVMLASLVFLWMKKSLQAIIFACPIIVMILLYASFAPGMDNSIKPLLPALKSNWLLIHVITCMMGYALLALGTVLTVYDNSFKSRENSSGEKEAAYVFISAGFVIFSFGIMTGAVWAQTAWGRYWGWDPKETWALITWLVYAAALHARKKSGNSSILYAGLVIFGLVCILFTYLGVNYLPGLHSYF